MNDSKQADKHASDGVIIGIQEVARVLWSVAALLAPWLVPLAPAIFFGWVIYQTATQEGMIDPLPTFAAVAAAVGLETVNIAANHAMLKLSHDFKEHPGKFALSILFIIVYVLIGVVAMAMLDVSDGVRIIGVGMFLLAPVAIGAQALTMDLVRVRDEGRKREEAEAEGRQWEREQEQQALNLAHQEKLARITANKEVRIIREQTRASTEPAPMEAKPAIQQYLCQQCNRGFGSVQALNAHHRFCAGSNGKEPATEPVEEV